MRTISRDIVGAVLISKDNRVLLGKTADGAGGVYSGAWVIPGGGIDEGESKKDALIREVREETHHDISGMSAELVGDTSTGESEKILKDTGERVLVKMNFYEFMVRFDKTADELGNMPSEELATLRWFSKEELGEAELSPPTRDLLQKLNLLD